MRRLLHTVRHLRFQQIAAQIVMRTRPFWDDPARLQRQPVPDFPGCAWRPLQPFLPPVQPLHAASIPSGTIQFLNQPAAIGWPPDWNRTDLPKLWLYHLHYFDWLWSVDRDRAAQSADDWMAHHPPALGYIGWEPYPTSLRLMNWCGIFFDRFRADVERDLPLCSRLWTSMYRQAEWLYRHCEMHLLGNHLLENAAALTVVGSCFAGADARRWCSRGVSLLRREIPEQILADGGHFERSPMYHSRAVYLLLMLRNLDIGEVNEIVEAPLDRGMDALGAMCHPDHRIALLNDSALGGSNEPDQLAVYAGRDRRLLGGSFALPQTGYYGHRNDAGDYLICDAGPIGPDYQPGHAHGDMLSFELSLGGHRVIIDSGVYDYCTGPLRDYVRSTRAHNTVEIDAADQCDFWACFRVGRRGRVLDVRWSTKPDGFDLSASTNAYRTLDEPALHRRSFHWRDGDGLTIRDIITSGSPHRCVSRLHLHPHCRIMERNAAAASVEHPGGLCSISFEGAGQMAVEEATYCPEFGRRLPNQVLAWTASGAGRIEIVTRIAAVRAAKQRQVCLDSVVETEVPV